MSLSDCCLKEIWFLKTNRHNNQSKGTKDYNENHNSIPSARSGLTPLSRKLSNASQAPKAVTNNPMKAIAIFSSFPICGYTNACRRDIKQKMKEDLMGY